MIKPNLTMGDSNPDTIKRLLGHPTPSFKGLEPLKVELGEHPIHKPETVEVPVHGISDPIKAEMPIDAEVVATSPSMASVKKDQEMKLDIHKNDTTYYNDIEQREGDAYSFIENMIEDAYSEEANTIEDNYATGDGAARVIKNAGVGAGNIAGALVGGQKNRLGRWLQKGAKNQDKARNKAALIKTASDFIAEKKGLDKGLTNMAANAMVSGAESAGKYGSKQAKKAVATYKKNKKK